MTELTKEWLNEYYLFLERLNEETNDCVYFGNEPFNEIWDENGYVGETEKIIENQYEVVDTPKGKRQELDEETEELIPDEYKSFLNHEYCDQWRNGGYTGDDYAGDMYYPLPNGQYMRIGYSC